MVEEMRPSGGRAGGEESGPVRAGNGGHVSAFGDDSQRFPAIKSRCHKGFNEVIIKANLCLCESFQDYVTPTHESTNNVRFHRVAAPECFHCSIRKDDITGKRSLTEYRVSSHVSCRRERWLALGRHEYMNK